MASNLDNLKDELYEAFSSAVRNAKSTYIGNHEGIHAASAGYRAAAELARSIVEVEREIAERTEKASGMKLPGKG